MSRLDRSTLLSSLCLALIAITASLSPLSHADHERRYSYEHARHENRPNHELRRFDSYTSPAIRGGSSRRTRVIENPYSQRLVTGITLNGIDNHSVHIKDVVGYPGRYFLSPLAYSLSAYEPARYINTHNYIDYISVAAKRREYFTVTFHYD